MGGDGSAPRRRTAAEGVYCERAKDGERLSIGFRMDGREYRISLRIEVNRDNIRFAVRRRALVLDAIAKGAFTFSEFFPESRYAQEERARIKNIPTIKTLVEDYIEAGEVAETLSATTAEKNRSWAKTKILPKFGKLPADQVTTADLVKWIQAMNKTNLSPKSIRNVVSVLRAPLGQAATHGVIASNPFAPIELDKILKQPSIDPDEEIDPFNDSEVSAIIEAARNDRERFLWIFGFSTGMRTGELIALRWEHIDWKAGVIGVYQNRVKVKGRTVTKRPKTNKVRELPMRLLPESARHALLALKALNPARTGYVFTLEGGEPWIDDQQLRKGAWVPTLKAAGVRYRYPYQMRHTFASKLLEQGEPETLVAKLLGHSTVAMVRKHYGKWIDQDGGALRGNYAGYANSAPHFLRIPPTQNRTGMEDATVDEKEKALNNQGLS